MIERWRSGGGSGVGASKMGAEREAEKLGGRAIGALWALDTAGGFRRQEHDEQVTDICLPEGVLVPETHRDIDAIGFRQRRAESLGRNRPAVENHTGADVEPRFGGEEICARTHGE